MTSARRVDAALAHRQPDRVPLDLGASAVTGMHASSVYKLRQALGLDRPGTPVKVVEPYQVLGEIAPDLLDALGVDVVGLGKRETLFGFRNEGWKEWKLFDGTPVLVPAGFNTKPEPNGDILLYPEGDQSVPASGRMPNGGYYFDSIVRQPPIDEDRLDPADNLEEFQPISDDDLAYLAGEARRLEATGRAILANFGGTAFGDIALVPAPWLKHPKGIRDVEEWYVSTAARRDYVYAVFERQCEIALANLGADPRGGRRPGVGGVHHGHRLRHAGGPVHRARSLPRPVPALPPSRERLGARAHVVEDLHPQLRLGDPPAARLHRGRLRHPQPGAALGRRAWTRRS